MHTHLTYLHTHMHTHLTHMHTCTRTSHTCTRTSHTCTRTSHTCTHTSHIHAHTPHMHTHTHAHTSHPHAAGDGGYDYDLIVIGGGSGGLACSKEGVALAAFASLPPSLLALPLPLPPSLLALPLPLPPSLLALPLPFPFLPSASSPFGLSLKQTPDFYVFFPSFLPGWVLCHFVFSRPAAASFGKRVAVLDFVAPSPQGVYNVSSPQSLS